MHILVTGATGFLGRPLVAALLAAGHSVSYLARQRSDKLDSRATYMNWAASEQEPSLAGAGDLNAVIHLAGEPVAQRWTAEVKARIAGSRLDGTRNLVRALGRLSIKPSVLVSASAIGYYGDREAEVLTENSGPGNGLLADLCVGWEREAQAAREIGLRVVSTRIGVVLDKDGGALGEMLPIFRMGLGGKLGSGRQWMSWIHRQDLIRLLQFAVENPAVAGPVNATSPNPVTNLEFTRELAKALHRPALFPVPRLALRLAMGAVADHILDSARVVPEAAQQRGFEFHYPLLGDCLRYMLT
jgi:uncharacterized protein (TIGR01777 family)